MRLDLQSLQADVCLREELSLKTGERGRPVRFQGGATSSSSLLLLSAERKGVLTGAFPQLLSHLASHNQVIFH